MIDDQDVRETFARMVAAGPPAPSSAAALTAGRRAHRRRTLLATGATAVAAAAVVLLAASASGGIGRGGPVTAAGPAPARPVVPGVAPADVPAVVARCAAAYELATGRTVPRAGLQLLNSAPDPEGTRYLLYGPDVYVSCERLPYGDYVAGGTAGQTRWMRAPLSADGSEGTSAPNDQGPGTWSVEGRVAATVAEVELRFGSGWVTVPAVNGTFMATVTVDSPELALHRPRVRALDPAGRVVYGSPTGSSPVPDPRCWVAPDGTVLKNDIPPAAGQKCLPATRWR